MKTEGNWVKGQPTATNVKQAPIAVVADDKLDTSRLADRYLGEGNFEEALKYRR